MWITLVAAAAGLAFVTVFLAFANYASPRLNLNNIYLILANAFLLLALSVVSLAYADDRRLRIRRVARIEKTAANILQHLDNIFHTRTGLSIHILTHQSHPEEISSCVAQSSEFLRYLIDETCAIFEDYTNSACAASIKLLVPSPDKVPSIKTYLRDKKSELIRAGLYSGDGIYSYREHSPFVDIISGRTEGDYFLSNDLRHAAARGVYRNGNKYWQKLYDATLIVPIKDPSTLSRENLLGFLCIDSLTGKFDEEGCLYVARIIANTIFYVIYGLSILESKLSAEPSPYADKKRVADA